MEHAEMKTIQLGLERAETHAPQGDARIPACMYACTHARMHGLDMSVPVMHVQEIRGDRSPR